MILFKNQTTNGVSPQFKVNNRVEVIVVEGNLGGGYITVEAKTDNTNWQSLRLYDGTIAQFTENTITNINQLKENYFYVRVRLTDSTAADVTVEML